MFKNLLIVLSLLPLSACETMTAVLLGVDSVEYCMQSYDFITDKNERRKKCEERKNWYADLSARADQETQKEREAYAQSDTKRNLDALQTAIVGAGNTYQQRSRPVPGAGSVLSNDARRMNAESTATVAVRENTQRLGTQPQIPTSLQRTNTNTTNAPRYREVSDATHCVQVKFDKYGYRDFFNTCGYAIELAWCTEGGMSFKCSKGNWGFVAVWTLPPGGSYTTGSSNSAVHFAACGEANAPPKETGPNMHSCDQKL